MGAALWFFQPGEPVSRTDQPGSGGAKPQRKPWQTRQVGEPSQLERQRASKGQAQTCDGRIADTEAEHFAQVLEGESLGIRVSELRLQLTGGKLSLLNGRLS